MEHRGVYGLWRQHGLLVAVRKARGPYTGLLDLPGGAPEDSETPEETLRRELAEECGVTLHRHGPWHPFELHVTRDSSGGPIDFRHRGLITPVTVLDEVAAVQDVTGVELVDPTTTPLEQLSALTQHALTILEPATLPVSRCGSASLRPD